ncbi:hypothetical protein FHW36_10495 [Chitinophaga polysaccharea]|uniref:Thioredoxin domain-containing protein n=1 Tax=Chitinophaga polysaccharea TaxID=1293035 RepID=A0A561PQP6_9BACT|nr:hypothetical protein [Chitinophaga polysaccharea]TWF40413.1 hypothetical protein FHW36_10495 [Chitinophaga polysaccharea]
MKESIKTLTSCFLFLSLYVIEVGCKGKEITKQTTTISQVNTQKYTLPKSLETFYTNPERRTADSAALMKAPYKLIVDVDFSCPVCIVEVDKWNNFYSDSLKKYQIPIVLLCRSDDKYRYMKYLFKTQKLKYFPFPLLLDINNETLRLNPKLISATGKVKTVFIGADSQILYTGFPLEGEKDKEDLIKAIASISPVSH